MKRHKQFFQRLGAAAFWLAVWQCAAWRWDRRCSLFRRCRRCALFCGFCRRQSSGSGWVSVPGAFWLGFGLGVAVSIVLAVAAQAWHTADVLLAPVLQLVKATPVASFIILALVWVRGHRFRYSSAF